MRFLDYKVLYLSLIIFFVCNPISTYTLPQRENYNHRNLYLNTSDFAIIKTNKESKIISFNESEEFGNQEIFWVLDVGNGFYVQKRATLLSVGEKCYIYFANETISTIGESTAISRSNYYRDEFDDLIYDKNIELMGSPDGRIGDIDGDPKVTIFVAPLNGAGGLYLQKDEMTGIYSNLREMVYIDSSLGTTTGALMTIMHEFNHLIWFNYEMDEGHFLLEGAAEFAVYYGGYLSSPANGPGINLTWHATNFKTNHQKSLLSFYLENNIPFSEDYGQAYMFMLYLVEQFGYDFLKELVLAQLDGPMGIDMALQANGNNITFNEVFLNWITTCAIDQESIANGLYGFNNADFIVDPDVVLSIFPTNKNNIKHYPYGLHVKKLLNPPDVFTFTITNPYPSYSLGISIAYIDQDGWHVYQTVQSNENEFIDIGVKGSNIEEAYICTSLMKQETPNAFIDFIEVTSEEYLSLDYSISVGFTNSTIMGILFVGFSISFSIGIAIVFRRRKKNYSWL